MTHPSSTRGRLITAMADALQRRGLHGVGLSELLAQAQAPKGVLYHHFPGGKTELAVAAIQAVVARITATLDRVIAHDADPVQALRDWMAQARRDLESSDFERGCPLATVALESTSDDVALRQALARGFEAIRDRLGQVFTRAGLEPAAARRLAVLVVSGYEGALMQSRVAGSATPMAETTLALLDVVQGQLRPT